MTTLVSLRGVSKTFDSGLRAIGNLEFNVEQGDFLSLVGPSGCGKSTVLRIIAGLLQPTSGAVTFAGPKPKMGFVFQEPTLMPWATALGNARLALDLTLVARHEAERRAREALVRVGLGGFEGAYPRELSGGMKMRVSIARAIAAQPKLILMDEPFAALDELTRQALNDDLLKLWREDALTVVFVTHSVFESAYLSSRVAVMTPRPGQIAKEIALDAPVDRKAQFRLSPEFALSAGKVSAALTDAMQRASA
jgi:NitT/TauT family transport system ATP-binding protein